MPLSSLLQEPASPTIGPVIGVWVCAAIAILVYTRWHARHAARARRERRETQTLLNGLTARLEHGAGSMQQALEAVVQDPPLSILQPVFATATQCTRQDLRASVRARVHDPVAVYLLTALIGLTASQTVSRANHRTESGTSTEISS